MQKILRMFSLYPFSSWGHRWGRLMLLILFNLLATKAWAAFFVSLDRKSTFLQSIVSRYLLWRPSRMGYNQFEAMNRYSITPWISKNKKHSNTNTSEENLTVCCDLHQRFLVPRYRCNAIYPHLNYISHIHIFQTYFSMPLNFKGPLLQPWCNAVVCFCFELALLFK